MSKAPAERLGLLLFLEPLVSRAENLIVLLAISVTAQHCLNTEPVTPSSLGRAGENWSENRKEKDIGGREGAELRLDSRA